MNNYASAVSGIPSPDTFERVFARIDSKEFKASFSSWTKELAGVFASEVIAIDGKTMRGAKQSGQSKSAVHMLSAWAVGLRLVLRQTKFDEKSNEITAIPEVLRILDIKGCIVTIDAMGCQQKISQQIIDQQGDYVLSLKGNQVATLEAIETHFSTFPETKMSQFEDVDKGHGRVETRSYYGANSDEILDLKEWPGVKSAVKVVSTRYASVTGVTSTETRFTLPVWGVWCLRCGRLRDAAAYYFGQPFDEGFAASKQGLCRSRGLETSELVQLPNLRVNFRSDEPGTPWSGHCWWRAGWWRRRWGGGDRGAVGRR